MIPSSIFLGAPLMLILMILQTSVLSRLPVVGVVPALPFLMALAWGLLRGPNEGVFWAFIAGFLTDLFSIAPFGGAALTYMATVLAATWMVDLLPPHRLLVPLLLAALATIVQQLLYTIYLRLFGYDLAFGSAQVTLVILNVLLMLPIYWLLQLIERVVWPKPVQL